MKYYLVSGGFNWADEMDLDGWDILSEEELNQLKIDFAPTGKYGNLSVEKYIGSNEEQEFSAADLFSDLSCARLLTDEEYNTAASVVEAMIGSDEWLISDNDCKEAKKNSSICSKCWFIQNFKKR